MTEWLSLPPSLRRWGLKRGLPRNARLWHRYHRHHLLKLRGGSPRLCSQGNLSDCEQRPQVSQLFRSSLGTRRRWPTPALSGLHRNKEASAHGHAAVVLLQPHVAPAPALPPTGWMLRPAAHLPLSFRQGIGDVATGTSFIFCFSILTPRGLVSFPSGRVWKSALFG